MISEDYYKKRALKVLNYFNKNEVKNYAHFMYHIDYSDNPAIIFLLESMFSYNEIIGTVTLCINKDTNYICNLSVSKAYRKRGYGNTFIAMCEQFTNLCKTDFIELYSLKDWHQQWYKRHGYIKIGEQDKYIKFKKQIRL